MMAIDLNAFAGPDPKLWRAQVVVHPRQPADPLVIDATITDSSGAPQTGVAARADVYSDDFFDAGTMTVTTDAAGKATFTFPTAAATQGSGNRFVHVTAGPMWPLVEAIAPISQ